jgi:3-oxoacyl-[acyl-carrier protein] reductase
MNGGMMGVLSNRIAIVTGGGKGIGEAIVREFAADGAQVAVVDIDGDGARRVAAAVEGAGGAAFPVQADVSEEASVAAMVQAVIQRFGSIDILVNNAGIYPRYVWHEMTLEQWDHIQAVNLTSCFLCSRAAFPQFRRKGSGKIINLSSVTFWLGQPHNLVHYISSKGGVVGFTRSLAHDVGEFNIQVNAITPGAVETEEEKKVATPEMVAAIVVQQCLGRRVTPRDIARTAVFLASSDSDMITGQTINVDAGWAMH